jgi:ribonuclease P protein component
MGELPGESFPRQRRLTRSREFQAVFADNFRVSDKNITILIGKPTAEGPRIGFAVAKKQIRRAIDRSRLKRAFRESFRKHQHCLPARDIVVMVRKKILDVDGREINLCIEKHWKNIIRQCANC